MFLLLNNYKKICFYKIEFIFLINMSFITFSLSLFFTVKEVISTATEESSLTTAKPTGDVSVFLNYFSIRS